MFLLTSLNPADPTQALACGTTTLHAREGSMVRPLLTSALDCHSCCPAKTSLPVFPTLKRFQMSPCPDPSQDDFYTRSIVKSNTFEPVMTVFFENGDRYNLLNRWDRGRVCACQRWDGEGFARVSVTVRDCLCIFEVRTPCVGPSLSTLAPHTAPEGARHCEA